MEKSSTLWRANQYLEISTPLNFSLTVNNYSAPRWLIAQQSSLTMPFTLLLGKPQAQHLGKLGYSASLESDTDSQIDRRSANSPPSSALVSLIASELRVLRIKWCRK
ncbi:hypothetical protein U1Q18_016250 [Sarracenia purpurea var. burkii]